MQNNSAGGEESNGRISMAMAGRVATVSSAGEKKTGIMELGWEPEIKFEELAQKMVEADIDEELRRSGLQEISDGCFEAR